MSGGQAFFISFLTAAVVSVGINVGFKLAAEKKEEPKPVAPVVEEPKEVTVPNLTGLTVAEAKARIQQVGLVAEVVEEESAEVPEGQVIETIPPRFMKLREGLVVKVKVSKGVATVEVPNVRKKHPRKARKMLEDAGFKVEQKNILNEDLMFDRVVRQEPDGGQQAAPGSTVIITVNTEEEYY